ncbi:ATP-binding protein [Labilibacter marinus]|uniref:ATP-binding protein n=1 Tax=Labilibacter marinus TaxID=1477105 RepID=UPI0008337D63|nr:ATP-binding protein [Labilibacter marinus]
MKLYLKFICALVFSLALNHISIAQNIQLQGSPFIENFDPNDNHGSKFIWSIAQDQRGIMFFGDRHGLLEFDGNSWRMHQVPNKSVIRSIDTGPNGIIYVGAVNEFGFFKPDSIGSLKYNSLQHLLPENFSYYQSVWKTFNTANGVYFFANNYIFRYKDNKIDTISVQLQSPSAFYIDNTIYIKDKEKGLAYINDTSIISLPGCEAVNKFKRGSFFIVQNEKDKLLLSTSSDKKTYKYDLLQNKLVSYQFPKETEAFIDQFFGHSITPIGKQQMAISTYSGGIALVDNDGVIIKVINESKGLSSNCVYALSLDREGNLWAATKRGVSRIDISYPISHYSRKQGLFGDVVNSIFHDKKLYIGTSINTYYLSENPSTKNRINKEVKQVKGIQKSEDFNIVNDHLLVCDVNGLSEIINGVNHKLLSKSRAFCTAYDKRYNNKLAVGQNQALVICTFKDNCTNKKLEISKTFEIKNNISQIRSMTFDSNGDLWLASYNEGISLIKFEDKSLEKYSITRFSTSDGLPAEIQGAFVTKFNNQINIFTQKGIYKPNQETKLTFDHDTYWNRFINEDSLSIIGIEQIKENQFFVHGDKTGIYHAKGDSSQLIEKPFNILNEIFSVSIRDQRYINIGASESILIYDTFKEKDYSKPFDVAIRKVVIPTNDSLIFNGTYLDADENKIVKDQPKHYIPELKKKFNSLQIYFSATFLEAAQQTQYKYKIEGFDKAWSPWTKVPSALYSELPRGKYTFKVKAKNVFGNLSSTASYTFVIKPAWYETRIAYIVYITAILIFITLIVKLYNRSLSKQNTKLEGLVKVRTSELSKAIDVLENQKIELKDKQKEILLQNTTLSEQGEELQKTINQLKETQSTLVQQEKMASLGILTAGVAHEINNPLNYILGGYTGLESYFDQQGEKSEDIEVLMYSIKTGVDRAAEIVSGLNQFSRTKNTFDENCDIHSILDNSILMIKHLTKGRIELIRDYDAASYNVMGNVGKVHQIFINILTNACQAIEDKGTINVTTLNKDNNLIISIQDTGEGIDMDHMDKITDPFFTTKEPGKGSGLGLSITYKIIQEHQGTLKFDSELGVSTTATITLPLI